MHNETWGDLHYIEKYFRFFKKKKKIQNFIFNRQFDIIYYDAFGSRVQPELWSKDLFKPIVDSLNHNGVFVTYSSMGELRRSLIELGMKVEKMMVQLVKEK